SEIAVHSMVDFFLLLMLAGAGDELQGIKRGIIEMAHLLAINKRDSLSSKELRKTRRAYKSALRLYPPAPSGWDPKVTACSAVDGTGIETIWEMIQDFETTTQQNGYFKKNRKEQAKYWMYEIIHQQLKNSFHQNTSVKEAVGAVEQQLF